MPDGRAILHVPRPLVRRQAPPPWDPLPSETGSYAHSMMDRYDPDEPEHLPGELPGDLPASPVPVQKVQAATGMVFDCTHDLLGWEFGWSLAKKEWCCAHEHRGCESVAVNTSAVTRPDEPVSHPLPQHFNVAAPALSEPEFHKVTGQEICEGRGFSEVACLQIGCCAFDAKEGLCYSAVSSSPCKSIDQASPQEWQPQQQSPLSPQQLQPQQQQQRQQGWVPASPQEWHAPAEPADFPKEEAIGAHASAPWVSVQYWWGPDSVPPGHEEDYHHAHEEDYPHKHHVAGSSHFKSHHHSHWMPYHHAHEEDHHYAHKEHQQHAHEEDHHHAHHAENHAQHKVKDKERKNKRNGRHKTATTKHKHEETNTTGQEAYTTEGTTSHEWWLWTTQQDSTTKETQHSSTTSIAGGSGSNGENAQSPEGRSQQENPGKNGSHRNNSHPAEADNNSHSEGSVPTFEHPITANAEKVNPVGNASTASSASSSPVQSGSSSNKPVASESTQDDDNEAGETEKEGKAKSAVQILIIVIACLIGVTCIIGMAGLIYITFIKGPAEEDTMEGELVQNAQGEGATEAGELAQPVQASAEPRLSGVGF